MKVAHPCLNCGRRTSARIREVGKGLCSRCQENRGERHECRDCGRLHYTPRVEEPKLCDVCVNHRSLDGKPCARCGRACAKGSRWWKEKPYCKRCKRHANEEKACYYCGALSTRAHRSPSLGLEEIACQCCQAKAVPLCTCCKKRERRNTIQDGNVVCHFCADKVNRPPTACVKCGRTSVLANSKRCRSCLANAQAHRSIAKMRKRLLTPWGESLFDDLYMLCGGRDRASPALARLSANFDGLLALEKSFRSPAEFDARKVFDVLTPNGDHKLNLALRRVIEIKFGIKTSVKDLGDVCFERFVAKRQAGAPDWVIETGDGFIARLKTLRAAQLEAGVTRGGSPIAWKSLELAYRYAHELMSEVHEAGGRSVTAIGQAQLDNFCVRRQKVFRGLGSFISYLNDTSHRAGRLTLPTPPSSRTSRANFIGQEAYEDLVANLLQESTPKNARNASIALLSLLYIRKITVVLSLRREDILDDGATMMIRFPGAKGSDEIHPGVAQLLRKWLSNWEMHSRSVTKENTPYVFPGLHPGQPLRPTAFHDWIRERYGVRTRELLASGIHVMINAGMATPAALTDHYGLSHSTAMKYWIDSGRELSQFMYLNSVALMEDRETPSGEIQEI